MWNWIGEIKQCPLNLSETKGIASGEKCLISALDVIAILIYILLIIRLIIWNECTKSESLPGEKEEVKDGEVVMWSNVEKLDIKTSLFDVDSLI